MNKLLPLVCSGLLLTGCSTNDDVVAAGMAGAVVGGMVGGSMSDDSDGALMGAMLGGVAAASIAQYNVNQRAAREYHQIVDYGVPNRRYVLSDVSGHVDLVVYPRHYHTRYFSGTAHRCRVLDIQVHDYGRVYNRSEIYCQTGYGWQRVR